MKAKNHKAITRGYLHFSGYLLACVVTGVFIYFCYVRTAGVEVERIVSKTEEYDKIYVRQIELAGQIDTLYRYITLMNTNLNDVQLLNSVSRRKQEILSSTDDLSNRNVRLHQKLLNQVNTFLGVKDSIRIVRAQEELVKTDLLKCVEENKQASRRLTLGGINTER